MAYDTDIERLNYYEGEFLGAVDFQAEQLYHRGMRRRHNLGQHTWGIVTGLELAQAPNGGMSGSNTAVDVYLQPGMAVDAFGREIVVLGQAQVVESMLAAFYDPNTNAAPVTIYLWIAYRDTLLQPSADTCASSNTTDAYSRVEETYTLTATATSASPANSQIVVDGVQITPGTSGTGSSPLADPPPILLPADGSVPFQELSTDDSNLNWWIPLGRVLWDPHNQLFLQSNVDPAMAAAFAANGREYAGNVSAAVYVPSDTYIIQNRDTAYPLPSDSTDPSYGGVQAIVAGSLQVDRLFNAETTALIGGVPIAGDTVPLSPLTIVADADSGLIQIRDATNQEKWLVSGSSNATQLGLNFGEIVPPNTAPVSRLFLESGGNIGVGTPTPQQNLSINAGLNLDQAEGNKGTLNPGLSFGSGSGEGIASNRATTGLNIDGLDFYTGSAIQMSLTRDGKLGIGTAAPGAQLEISGGQGDVTNTPGDVSIGNSASCLKLGVTLSGVEAGDARIRAMGGSNRLLLGSASDDTVTITDGTVNTSGNLTVGIGPLLLRPVPAPGALNVNGNRTYMLGTDPANFHWIMAGGFLEATATSGNNAIGMTYDSVHGQGYIVINPNWTLAAGGPKIGFVVDRFLSRDEQALERGDVVVIHKDASGARYCKTGRIPLIEVTRTTVALDNRVCGIVDEPSVPAAVLRDLDPDEIAGLTIGIMVTLGAYSHCKVDADIAPIAAGDLLTTSATPGYAQKLPGGEQPRSGVVIGKALASLNSGKGMIPLLISHQ
jgi:hypothetical protein